ncbi:MAG: hypothetical protein B7Y39_07370 [Bdellovibrio sp. 28-41-41]|nr:MAG: hypothetical protein B7Y39_07370 [Bdellovibrio sp. 28-41-41]
MDIYAFVLEDEDKFQKQIFQALRKINPKLKIRFFNTLEDFSAWIAHFIKEGLSVVETAGFRLAEDTEIESVGGEKNVRLLMCKSENLGVQSISLIGKTIDLFARKNLCTKEEKTAVVLTAFDHEKFDLKSLEASFVNNIIFKPFDALILEEHTRYALVGRKKPNDENFKSNKLEAQVEMVKDIPCEGFSDLGFITISDREVVTGSISKFYSTEFASEAVRSVMAKCVKSIPNTGKDQTGFLCWMEYFALEVGQIKKFRKDLINEFPTGHMDSRINEFKKNILILDSLGDQDLSSSLKRYFPKSATFYYSSWDRFAFDSTPEASGLLVEKDVPIPSGYKMTLDGTGHYIIGQDPKSETDLVFGEVFSEIKKKDFHVLLSADGKKEWTEVFNAKQITPGREPILVINNLGKIFMARLVQFRRTQNAANMSVIEIMFSELTMAEKVAYLKSKSPIPKTVDVVIASIDMMPKIIESKLYPNAKRILIVPDQVGDKDKREWAPLVYDIFESPADRNYLVKRIYLSFMEKFTWTVNHFNKVKTDIQSAQQIQIDEISEAGIVFKYHRPLEIGSFRRFYLWTPNEVELRDYHANCNYFEEVKDGKTTVYNHHFVFFAMKDYYLKNIRLWVRENYILSKSKE